MLILRKWTLTVNKAQHLPKLRREKFQKKKIHVERNKAKVKNPWSFPHKIIHIHLSICQHRLEDTFLHWIITNFSKFGAWAQYRAACIRNEDIVRGFGKNMAKASKNLLLSLFSFSLLKL